MKNTEDIKNILNKEKIIALSECENIYPIIYGETDSTNLRAKEVAANAPEGTVIIAHSQTAGRGRLGRSFFSPDSSGLYMSIILHPDISAEKCIFITTAAAVAVCETLEDIIGCQCGIKWVNDIFIDGKKVCGILTESIFSGEKITAAILGIGINIYEPADGFPPELKDIAGAAAKRKEPDLHNLTAAGIIRRFMKYYKAKDTSLYLDSYRKRNFVCGKKVYLVKASGEKMPIFVEGIDNNCRLIVRHENGDCDCISSGEISLRFS